MLFRLNTNKVLYAKSRILEVPFNLYFLNNLLLYDAPFLGELIKSFKNTLLFSES